MIRLVEGDKVIIMMIRLVENDKIMIMMVIRLLKSDDDQTNKKE